MDFRKITWYNYYLKNIYKILLRCAKLPLAPPAYKSSSKLDREEAQNFIAERIRSAEPTMIARYGCYEAQVTADAIGVLLNAKKHIYRGALSSIYNNAGLFPYGEGTTMKFAALMEDSSQSVDLMGVWDTYMQDYLIETVCRPDMKITRLSNLEPYYEYHTLPWSSALEGKKVVVVHPFTETIMKQYQMREVIFDNKHILPVFSLRTVKAVQTIAGAKDNRFSTWFDALEYMYQEVVKEDFDVAIIGCGAYGFPLAAKIKNYGKVAIHLGGATQVLFGIKGGRWDADPVLSRLYNEYWTYPLPSETPENAKNVENGCYW